MNPKICLMVLLTTLLTFCSCVDPERQPNNGQSDSLATPNPFSQNARLARTMNLGNALEAPTEGAWGLVLQESWFRIIHDAGFSAVRIPIRWSAHAGIESPYTLHSNFLDRVDWAINQALENGLAVVFNIHHYEEIFAEPATHQPRLLALWRQLAEHYRSQPDDVIFELLNEPHDQLTPELWNSYLAEGIALIREIDPRRTLMIGTAGWGGLSALNELSLPADSNLIVTIHYYEPFHFTHQGAEWVVGSDDWLGITWNGSEAERTAIESHFEQIRTWASAHNRPVFVGEFGAYNRADQDSRFRWTRAVVEICEARNFSWGYWEFASGFGAYDPSQSEWTILLQALIRQ